MIRHSTTFFLRIIRLLHTAYNRLGSVVFVYIIWSNIVIYNIAYRLYIKTVYTNDSDSRSIFSSSEENWVGDTEPRRGRACLLPPLPPPTHRVNEINVYNILYSLYSYIYIYYICRYTNSLYYVLLSRGAKTIVSRQ